MRVAASLTSAVFAIIFRPRLSPAIQMRSCPLYGWYRRAPRHNPHTRAHTGHRVAYGVARVCYLELLRVNWGRMSNTAALNIGTYLTRAAEQVPDRLAVACG